MRKLAMAALALMCVAGSASVATAQGGGGGMGGRGQRGNAIDRWLTRPDTIKLSAGEQTKVDSLKAQYSAEQTKLMADAGGDRAAMAPKITDLNTKYQGLVKAALTPANQAAFDKNIANQPAPGRRGGGGGG